MFTRTWTALVCCLTVITCVAGNVSAAGSVSTLHPVVLHRGDVPGGFTENHAKLFGAFSSTMKVAGLICNTPANRRSDWKQGLHQVFLKTYAPTRDVDDLETCAYAFKSDAPAIADFNTTAAAAQQSLQKKVTLPLAAPELGNGIVAAVAPYRNHSGAYLLVFRYQNSLVGLSYLYNRKPILSQAQFVRIAKLLYARLVKGR